MSLVMSAKKVVCWVTSERREVMMMIPLLEYLQVFGYSG
jgi:hypothetical protein